MLPFQGLFLHPVPTEAVLVSMKLDQKYFVPFLAVMAIVTALLITFFTVSSQQGQREAFREAIMQQDSLRNETLHELGNSDSLSVSSISDKYVVLDFWATWSNFSLEIHRELAQLVQDYPGKIEIIAAVVQDQPDKITSYMERHNFPFHFVNGTAIFNKYQVPGMPTEIIYNPEGVIQDVYFGYSDTTQFNRLRTLLENGE